MASGKTNQYRCPLYDDVGSSAKNLFKNDFLEKSGVTVTLHPRLDRIAPLADWGRLAMTSKTTASVHNQTKAASFLLAPTISHTTPSGHAVTTLAVELSGTPSNPSAKTTLTHACAQSGCSASAEWDTANGGSRKAGVTYRGTERCPVSFETKFSPVKAGLAQAEMCGVACVLARRVRLGGALTVVAPRSLGERVVLTRDDVTKAEVAVSYAPTQDIEITYYVRNMGRLFGCSAFARLLGGRAAVALETQFESPAVAGKATSAGCCSGCKMPKVEAAAEYRVDENSVVKAKVDTSCLLSLSYSQKLSKFARAVFGATVNTSDLSSTSKHTVGFSLVLSD